MSRQHAARLHGSTALQWHTDPAWGLGVAGVALAIYHTWCRRDSATKGNQLLDEHAVPSATGAWPAPHRASAEWPYAAAVCNARDGVGLPIGARPQRWSRYEGRDVHGLSGCRHGVRERGADDAAAHAERESGLAGAPRGVLHSGPLRDVRSTRFLCRTSPTCATRAWVCWLWKARPSGRRS